VNSMVCFVNTYPVDSTCIIQPLDNWGLTGAMTTGPMTLFLMG